MRKQPRRRTDAQTHRHTDTCTLSLTHIRTLAWVCVCTLSTSHRSASLCTRRERPPHCQLLAYPCQLPGHPCEHMQSPARKSEARPWCAPLVFWRSSRGPGRVRALKNSEKKNSYVDETRKYPHAHTHGTRMYTHTHTLGFLGSSHGSNVCVQTLCYVTVYVGVYTVLCYGTRNHI